jgi:demethylmenaquinone methyltransferase/2-methoxy-6-polyprenyl-1,4-benzoquinol methylase
MTDNKKNTHFGFQSVGWTEKEKHVTAVFESVAINYDLMNDIMSFGIHRLWKRFTSVLSQVHPGQTVLDLAGGSGDLTRLLSHKVGINGCVVLADINKAMLSVGRDRLIDGGILDNVYYAQANAQYLPFIDKAFNCIIMAFGLRNVTDKDEALRAIFRVCKPGGRVMILEFSTPVMPGLRSVYDWYSFTMLPKLGHFFAKDAASYQYLAESIRMHPNQSHLKSMIEQAGFEDCHYYNLTGGIVALHVGYKY